MKTISILNLKGGVAKTFTAANMAYELYRRGYKVLLIDNDKQGNLSKAYSRYDAENVAPVTRLLAGGWESADELIQHTEYEGIELAKQLGVDAEGTKKEIATRCAAVEVDIPDESELTEEDKRAAEEAAAEAAAKAEEEEAATELVKVKAQRRFLDKELNQIKDTGDEYAVSRERAAVLEEAGVAAVIEE